MKELLRLPNSISEIKEFYNENEFVKQPSFILDQLREKKAYNSVDANILTWLMLARLIWVDIEKKWVKNSDLMIQVWEYPTYYVWSEQKWLRDERFPRITKELMDKIFEYTAPEYIKKNIIDKKAKQDRNDLDEDFAITFEVNTNFDYNEWKEDSDLYFTKPQYTVTDQVDLNKIIWRFRVNLAQSKWNKFIVFRKLEADVPDFYELWLDKKFLQFNEYKEWLVLVTWPTGSGKSTTLASLINEINKTKHKHIITIEDPIEFVHPNKNSLFNQREVPSDTISFSSWLKSALREKPDIILIWELRDIETIRLAIEAAETWHLVFGTLHTFNAAKTIDRIINSFPAEEQNQIAMTLSSSLVWVISQTLVKTKSGWITALNEMLKVTDWIRSAIAEMETGKVIQAASNSPQECMLMIDHAFSLITSEKINASEALSILYKKDKPTYEELVSKLRWINLYNPNEDPYSERNIKKQTTYTEEEKNENEVAQVKPIEKRKIDL